MLRKALFLSTIALMFSLFAGNTSTMTTQAYAEEYKYIGKEGCRECHTKLFKSYDALMKRGVKKPRRLPHSTEMLADLGSVQKGFKESKKNPGFSKYKTKEKQRVDLAKLKIDWDKDYSKDDKCLKCHATGSGTATGYDAKAPNPNLSGVGCESCHGPASAYVPYMEKAAENYNRDEALKLGMAFPQGDKGKKACVDSCHNQSPDCPIIAAIDGYKFDYEKRRTKAHKPKTGKW